ncbi:MAG: hypothetical protein MRK01_01570 [Candidatus Scalindua sp.]|nr:hypothetical protein [Candidatus Scalindua sp.]
MYSFSPPEYTKTDLVLDFAKNQSLLADIPGQKNSEGFVIMNAGQYGNKLFKESKDKKH